MQKLTRTTIDAAWRRRGDERTILRDHEVKGLSLAINATSATWRLEYRLPGVHPQTGSRWPNRTMALGALTPDYHLADARRDARAAKARVAAGVDPGQERRAELTRNLEDAAAGEFTVAHLIERFRAAREPRWRPATAKAFGADLAEIEKGIGRLAVTRVTRRHLAGFLRDWHDRQAAAGRKGTRVERLAMLLGSMFLFALDREWIEVSPAQRLPRPAVAGERDRVLTAAEIKDAWAALSHAEVTGIGPLPLLVLKLSLVTGQRIGTVAAARRDELHLDGHDAADELDTGAVWIIPPEAGRKAKHHQIVPLSSLSVRLWREVIDMPKRESGQVFPGKGGAVSLRAETVSGAWVTLKRAGAVPADAVAHDLRRTARTWWGRLDHGQPTHVLERLYGHAVGSKIERTYDRGLYLPQMRLVADAWGRKLETIIAGGGEVVRLKSAG